MKLTNTFCYILGCFNFTNADLEKYLIMVLVLLKINLLKLFGGIVHHILLSLKKEKEA
jgi:hypothetical protein